MPIKKFLFLIQSVSSSVELESLGIGLEWLLILMREIRCKWIMLLRSRSLLHCIIPTTRPPAKVVVVAALITTSLLVTCSIGVVV